MRIAVSGINANDNPGPGIGVARSLKEADPTVEIIGVSYDGNDSGHYLKHLFDRTEILPYPSRGWSEVRAKLTAIHRLTPLDLLIPCLDAELPLFIQNQAEIEKDLGIRVFLPTQAQFEERGKNQLTELAEAIGAKYPKTAEVDSAESLRKTMDESFPFPFYLKGKYYKAYRITSHHEAFYHFEEIAREWGFPLLLQQIVKGTEINLIGLADGEGKLLGSVAIKKTSTTPLGKIWTAVTIRNEALTQLAQNFARQTNWRGPFELECIATTKEIHVIEINPRFPAWVYFATACGVNLPAALVQLVFENKRATFAPPPVGKLLIRYCEEMVADWAQVIKIDERDQADAAATKKNRKAA